ncbi:MAG: ABC transporter permease [Flavobacteriaceae bacterium]
MAWRYLFSKSQQSVVNLITYVTLLVIVVASAALLVVLSAFSGLKAYSTDYTLRNSADYTLISARQELFEVSPSQLEALGSGGIEIQTLLKKQALLTSEGQTAIGWFLSDPMGSYDQNIEPLYGSVAPSADSLLINLELYRLFGVHPDDGLRINLSVPKLSDRALPLRLGGSPLTTVSGEVAGVYQERTDNKAASVLMTYELASTLLGLQPGIWVTQIDLNTFGIEESALRDTIYSLFGDQVVLRSRAESNASLFKLLNSEYVATYVIFSLILVLALFNLAGALSVVVLDKRVQLPVLKQLGMTRAAIKGVFFWLGWLQVAVGSLIGVMLGLLLVWSQQLFGWVRVSLDMAYPVALNASALILVLVTLVVLGGLASWAAVLFSRPLRQL